MTKNESTARESLIPRGIITGVVASLIVITLIQPILRLAWSATLTLGSRFLQSYVDSIYASAALGHRNYVDVILLMVMFSIISGTLLGMTSILTRRIFKPERRPHKPGKRHLLLFWLCIVLFHISAVVAVVRPYADLQLNTSFQQRVKVLAPKLTDLEQEELEAAWASMQTRADYEVLRLRLEKKAEEFGITLPKALWK